MNGKYRYLSITGPAVSILIDTSCHYFKIFTSTPADQTKIPPPPSTTKKEKFPILTTGTTLSTEIDTSFPQLYLPNQLISMQVTYWYPESRLFRPLWNYKYVFFFVSVPLCQWCRKNCEGQAVKHTIVYSGNKKYIRWRLNIYFKVFPQLPLDTEDEAHVLTSDPKDPKRTSSMEMTRVAKLEDIIYQKPWFCCFGDGGKKEYFLGG